MIRRFNYTDRKKISRRSIRIKTNELPHPEIAEVTWDLSEYGFPDSASVFVEATTSGAPAILRFPFGTVAEPSPPSKSKRSLEELPGEACFFDLKVVDSTAQHGLILGIARGVQPFSGDASDGSNRQAMLPVNPVDLDQEVWRVDFGSDRPYLEVNRNIEGIMDIIRADGRFISLVFPAVVRRILIQILIVEQYDEVDAKGDWQGQWLAMACGWHPDQTEPPAEMDEKLDWIEQAALGFAASQRVRDAFESAITGEAK